MSNPVKDFTKKEWSLWLGSLLIVVVSNLFSGDVDLPTLVAALVGVTSLIFAAKGNVWAQILMVVFSILYGIISWRFRYWGEMMTYLGMTLPMAVWSTITWLKNPSETNGSEVAIQQLNRCHVFGLFVSGIIVTVIFVIFVGFKNPQSSVQHDFHYHQLCGGGTDHAAFFLLCGGVCCQ